MLKPMTVFDDMGEPLAARVSVGLSKIGMALRSRTWQQAAGSGLTPTQGQVLALLRSRGSVRVTAVAEALGIRQPTASDAVSALVRKGLVEKRAAEDDRRAADLRLTETGRTEADRARAWPDFLAAAVEAMTPDEQAVFLRGLVKMVRTLQQRGEIAPERLCVTCCYFRPNASGDASNPHICDFVGAPFGDRHLRIDCDDHQPAEDPDGVWQRFCATPSSRPEGGTGERL